jgi:hypothetical protein
VNTTTAIDTTHPPTRSEVDETAEPRTLTAEEIERAIDELPPHRTDLRDGLKGTLSYVRRGIPIKANAPAWIQARNASFAYEGDGDAEED